MLPEEVLSLDSLEELWLNIGLRTEIRTVVLPGPGTEPFSRSASSWTYTSLPSADPTIPILNLSPDDVEAATIRVLSSIRSTKLRRITIAIPPVGFYSYLTETDEEGRKRLRPIDDQEVDA